TATIMKMISLTRLNSRQRAYNQLRDWLKQDFPGEVVPAKKDMRGNFLKPGKDKGLITLLEDGKMVGYEVDKSIADSVNHSKDGDVMFVGHLINKVFGNQIFKNMYITYNPGFTLFNIQRDMRRNYANLSALGHTPTIREMLVSYVQSIKPSIRRQMGIDDPLIREMMENYALDIPFIDFNFSIRGDEYNGTLRQLGLLKGEEHLYHKMMKPLLRPLLMVMEGIRFAGSTLETMGKVAGYKILESKKKYSGKQLGYLTRNFISTPNYRRGGTLTSVTNAVWMFSNIIKEGLKTDYQLATNPKTRSGFWWAHFKMDMVPKFLMFLAASGLIGKELKDQFDKISEYDKTNYIIIPVGENDDGTARYFRMPHDESGRLMAAIFWKALTGIYKKDPQQLQQIFAFGAGQLPSLAPGITLLGGWTQYLSGKNPYDPFRGHYVVSDMAWKAGGWPALKKMVQWTANNTGLLSFATHTDKNESLVKTAILSISGVNRIFKSSDYGITESLRKQRDQIEKRQARRTLLKRELVDKGIEQIAGGANPNEVALEIARKVYENPTTEQKTRIQKDLKQEKERGENVYIDMLLTARSNEEKVLIMREMRKVYDSGKMTALERKILNIKAASADVIRESRR
ncbi:MAG: hypothetical protein NUV91_09275, partial [Candidatus Omnitrophica bacterium]|nr:hypothetical protein [Candidatus Omnitrophota bacterium]